MTLGDQRSKTKHRLFQPAVKQTSPADHVLVMLDHSYNNKVEVKQSLRTTHYTGDTY